MRGLKSAPPQAGRKLQLWILQVETEGLEATRKVRGFDDHTLKGQRKGQRAIRLTRQWRAIYTEQEDGKIEFAQVEEVHPHKY